MRARKLLLLASATKKLHRIWKVHRYVDNVILCNVRCHTCILKYGLKYYKETWKALQTRTNLHQTKGWHLCDQQPQWTAFTHSQNLGSHILNADLCINCAIRHCLTYTSCSDIWSSYFVENVPNLADHTRLHWETGQVRPVWPVIWKKK